MNNDPCKVCELLAKNSEEVVVYSGQHWRVALNPNQEYLGRCYVTMKKHTTSVNLITEQEWGEFTKISKKLENHIEKAFSPTHFNWSCLMNNAMRDNESTHVHWHLAPRYDRKIELFDETFEDHDWPNKYTNSNRKILPQDTLEQIKNKIN